MFKILLYYVFVYAYYILFIVMSKKLLYDNACFLFCSSKIYNMHGVIIILLNVFMFELSYCVLLTWYYIYA